ncbi:MAG TPA: DPP IV N-terminal domain-containing protein, partial [Ignavibacteriaceae bacterium]|nr:DPP IV N-terminal domain-containing protein [Ignavibacteriaceae bacterium]
MRLMNKAGLIIFICSVIIFAQNKNLTMEQVILHGYSLTPEKLSGLNWIPDTEDISFIDTLNGEEKIFRQSYDSNEKKEIIGLSAFSKKLNSEKANPLNRFPNIEWVDKNSFKFEMKNKLYSYNKKTGKIRVLNSVDTSAENIDYATNNGAAYTLNNNLYVAVNGKQLQITNDSVKDIVNGQAVHRNEFGIIKGTFWSPSGKYLAFYRMDETMVTDYPIVDLTVRPAVVAPIKYPMAGMTSHEVTVGIYNTEEGTTHWLKTGTPKDQYLTGVTWDPNEKLIYIGILNRDQNHLQLKAYDIKTGKEVRILFEESNDKYVEPLQGPIFVKNQDDEFIWVSFRDGWNHLYLYKTDGSLVKKLTEGDWNVIDFDGFDSSGENIYFTSTKDSPIERQ